MPRGGCPYPNSLGARAHWMCAVCVADKEFVAGESVGRCGIPGSLDKLELPVSDVCMWRRAGARLLSPHTCWFRSRLCLWAGAGALAPTLSAALGCVLCVLLDQAFAMSCGWRCGRPGSLDKIVHAVRAGACLLSRMCRFRLRLSVCSLTI